MDLDFREKHDMYASVRVLLEQTVSGLAPTTVEQVLKSLPIPESGADSEGERRVDKGA